jgi:hypothetical protein
MAYPATTIYHLPMMYSDHAPILAVLNSQRVCTNKPFRFENWWLMEQEYHEVARKAGFALQHIVSLKKQVILQRIEKVEKKEA